MAIESRRSLCYTIEEHREQLAEGVISLLALR